ncbi:hypothetical protein GGR56DRAFT_684926 [Xylariaceae sp. FL0804]|nr:hypothetical protein GGR56DRAFT_684926 [Xylariaceae sp. FL0804]
MASQGSRQQRPQQQLQQQQQQQLQQLQQHPQHQQHQQSRPPTPSQLYHALLRPAVLQILRAQGYYASTPATMDALTELAGHYLALIAARTAVHAAHNSNDIYSNPIGPGAGAGAGVGFFGGSGGGGGGGGLGVGGGLAPTVVDVRLALEDVGALLPERELVSQELAGREDTRGVDEFVRWAAGRRNQRIRRVAGLIALPGGGSAATAAAGEDGVVEERPTDYLDALKRKHNKTDQDSKWAGTVLGRGIDQAEVPIEGGGETSLAAWARKMHEASLRTPAPQPRDDVDVDAESERPPSSGLSSLADDQDPYGGSSSSSDCGGASSSSSSTARAESSPEPPQAETPRPHEPESQTASDGSPGTARAQGSPESQTASDSTRTARAQSSPEPQPEPQPAAPVRRVIRAGLRPRPTPRSQKGASRRG